MWNMQEKPIHGGNDDCDHCNHANNIRQKTKRQDNDTESNKMAKMKTVNQAPELNISSAPLQVI